MPNVNAVLNEQIRRLSRREITAGTKVLKKVTARYRTDIATLKRQVAALVKAVSVLQKQMPSQTPTPKANEVQKARLRIDGLKAHRARLGLSAAEYGKLLGVSSQTVYHWEAGKSKPRRNQLPAIVAVRGIGKREALQRLGMTAKNVETPSAATKSPLIAKSRKRSIFSQTAEAMILGLLKGRRAMRTAQINAAWKAAGRAGTADVTLGRMVKARKIKRIKVPGQRGGEYRIT